MSPETDEIIQKAVQNIMQNHDKIIDDWCKAYMAQLYAQNGAINPGDFILFEQDISTDGKYFRKYWFEPKVE